MGNDKSLPSDLHLEDTIKVSSSWALKSATLHNGNTKICVFEQSLSHENVNSLYNLSKNLMLHRHPCILKYISSWKTNKMLYVATEYARPLVNILDDLLPIQLCIGLSNILEAVIFLQDKASSTHNNLSKSAIYITNDESWKLGQLELLTRYQDNEKNDSLFADQRSFIALALEIVEGKSNDEIPYVEEFREFCKLYESSKIPNPRFLRELFAHSFFTHEFISLYSFLSELPVKSEEEKSDFFFTVAEKLSLFPEELVARQLSTFLLSRLVLLNSTAQTYLLPKIFNPKSDSNPSSLFGELTMKNYVIPRLLSIFSLRDSQIRLILLKYFSSFHGFFTKEQLQQNILPELLVGIKDTNELLVAATLRTLADLVPVLGASVVIGKRRAKLFADGRPSMKCGQNSSNFNMSPSQTVIIAPEFTLAERPSPDGGEDSTESSNIILEESVELNQNNNTSISLELPSIKSKSMSLELSLNKSKSMPLELPSVKSEPVVSVINDKSHFVELNKIKTIYTPIINDEDLSTLDIKCSKVKNDETDMDIEKIFKDMEPVISRTAVVNVKNSNNVNKFKAMDIDCSDEGWGDDAAINLDELENDD